jgi:ElaB/YqjD/DUF883 family membrane-anchored ribosome-binding protein
MSNQLVNSMVRGFGLTLGRKAANSLTQPRPTQQQVSFTRKQLEIMNEYKSQIKELENILVQTEGYFKDGKITEDEYDILKYQATNSLQEAKTELEKVENVGKEQSSSFLSSLIKWFLIIFFGIPMVLGILSAVFS